MAVTDTDRKAQYSQLRAFPLPPGGKAAETGRDRYDYPPPPPPLPRPSILPTLKTKYPALGVLSIAENIRLEEKLNWKTVGSSGFTTAVKNGSLEWD